MTFKTRENIRTGCIALICVNGVAGPIIKFGYGYENVPWVLVGPRMVFVLAAAVLLLVMIALEYKDFWQN